MSQRKLDIILSRKRNKPKAYRALKRKEYKQLFASHCPRMVRYKPSKEIARAVVKHVTKGIPRLKAKQLAWKIYSRMHMLPLRIGVEKPGLYYGRKGAKWYKLGIRDNYIRKELELYLSRKRYTYQPGAEHVRSRKHNFRTIFIHTY